MIELAGEIADGLLGHLYSLPYLRDFALPRLAAGADRAGRDPESLERCLYLSCCVSPDRAEALRRARIQVGFYVFLPSSDPIVRWHGLEKEQAAVREALQAEGPGALERVTDDKLVQAFSIAGTPDECRRRLADYADLVSLPLLHVPYFAPLTPEESEDAFRHILETFGN
jgi:alkanesulfonate monooxygenase SsuD/methylene tetrahydromethanopterin reductase-like flavin-dependent oxidoreductase (luciferase family)